ASLVAGAGAAAAGASLAGALIVGAAAGSSAALTGCAMTKRMMAASSGARVVLKRVIAWSPQSSDLRFPPRTPTGPATYEERSQRSCHRSLPGGQTWG